jgi:membrane protease YdiL (CAAX protease family)
VTRRAGDNPADSRADTLALAGLAAAYPAFAATFRGPKPRFWQRMTMTGAGLGSLSLGGDPTLRAELTAVRPRHLVQGAAVAAGLYGIFLVGDRAARVIMPSGSEDIAEVYSLRSLRPVPEIALRLAAVIGPAEEFYWRGLLHGAATRRFGRWPGAAVAAGAYGGAHLVTGNATLIGAASVAGAYWSALRGLGVPMPALLTSHVLWDIWIFLVQPTTPE